MEEHSHTPWVIGLIIFLLVGLGIGGSVGTMVGKNQRIPTKTIRQLATDGVNIGNVRVAPNKDIADNLVNLPDASKYLELLKSAGLEAYLHGVGPYTVILPLNESLNQYDESEISNLQTKEGQTALNKLLLANVFPGVYSTASLRVLAAKNETIKSLSGTVVRPIVKDNVLSLVDTVSNTTTVINISDAVAANGIMQVSSDLLIPYGVDLSIKDSQESQDKDTKTKSDKAPDTKSDTKDSKSSTKN